KFLTVSDGYVTHYRAILTGQAYPQISLQQVRETPIPLPPLPEQQKIADILTVVDDKLDVIARQIEVTQTLKQGLMQTLFSRGVGNPDANGLWVPHTEFKNSELGEIPVGWLVTTLGAICNGALQTGPFGSQLHAAEYQDEGVPVLMPKDLLKYRANLSTAARITPARAEELAKHKLVAGDLLFSRRGDVARFALIDEISAGALCGTGCLKAKPSEGYSSAYLAHLLQLDVVRAWLEQNAVGQTMPNMNTGILASLPLIAPENKQEQEEIAGILDSIDAKTRVLFSKQLHFQTLKRGLMQKLLTGEWRVKLASPTGVDIEAVRGKPPRNRSK
ncbi:Restriction modification system DNA specificity domain-containing protein, partial [Pseudomonas savastanoi]